MKTFTVKEISEMLGTNPETVRRWIRSGKLKAEQDSRKEGNEVSEEEFNSFLKKTPKYATIVGDGLISAFPAVGIPLALGGLVGTVFIEYLRNEEKIKNSKIDVRELTSYMEKLINGHENIIKQKENAIAQLHNEIIQEQNQIEALSKTIQMIHRKSKEGIK